jgi:WD40 repeat protein
MEYRLIKTIGNEGVRTKFLAVDEGQFPFIRCIIEKISLQDQNLKNLQQLVIILEEICQHPQIPTLIAYFNDENYFYLVEEFIDGIDLATLGEQEINNEQVWRILASILPVLKFIHSYKLIHGDINPENIIIDKEGNFRLINLSQLLITQLLGNPEYIAPEQSESPVYASDLYSLGVTCIHLLTQIPPFDLFDTVNNCFSWRDYLTVKVDEKLGKILDKLIENNVTRRFQSADEVMEVMGIQTPTYPKSQNLNSLWQCIHTFTQNPGESTAVNTIASSGSLTIAFHPDGTTLASADSKTIKLRDINSKNLLYTSRVHTQVTSISFSPNGILASASDDKTIKLWNLKNKGLEEILTLQGHLRAVKSIAFSPDGKILASGSWDKTIKLWDVDTGREIITLTGHKLQVSAVAFNPHSHLLASASFDRTVCLWELPINSQLKNCPYCTLSGHTRAVLAIAFSPDGKMATGSDDNTIKLWDVNTGQLIHTLSGHSWSVVALAFSIDGNILVSGSWDKTIKLWQISTMAEITTISGHLESVSAIAVNPVAQLIASSSRDNTIKLWQPKDPKRYL